MFIRLPLKPIRCDIFQYWLCETQSNQRYLRLYMYEYARQMRYGSLYRLRSDGSLFLQTKNMWCLMTPIHRLERSNCATENRRWTQHLFNDTIYTEKVQLLASSGGYGSDYIINMYK